MKRIRLDIGALTASPEGGGSFMFFLYREGMDKCLPVKLTPPEMHAVLSNFNQTSGNTPTIHSKFFSTLQSFRIELLEVTVARDAEDENFTAQLLFFDGEKEVTETTGFIDGIIMAKAFACPIYIGEELMEKYASKMDLISDKAVKKEIRLQKLKEELSNAIAAEDYERAAQLKKAIDKTEQENGK